MCNKRCRDSRISWNVFYLHKQKEELTVIVLLPVHIVLQIFQWRDCILLITEDWLPYLPAKPCPYIAIANYPCHFLVKLSFKLKTLCCTANCKGLMCYWYRARHAKTYHVKVFKGYQYLITLSWKHVSSWPPPELKLKLEVSWSVCVPKC